jgi:DNA primase
MSEKIKILQKYLGPYDQFGDQLSFCCPRKEYHNESIEQKKLSINIKTGLYHCWVCDFKGKSLTKLLKYVNASKSDIERFKSLHKNINPEVTQDKSIDKEKIINLPKDFISLLDESDDCIFRKRVLNYVKNRGLTDKYIYMYNLGYSLEKKFIEHVIIPSYDINGNLNYFQGRNINPNVERKYINPNVERYDIIPFELYVNWSEPIIIVEGFFDMNPFFNCLPLLGSNLAVSNNRSSYLIQKIIERKTPSVYIMLDPDAIKKAHKILNRFYSYGIETFFVDIEDNKDPGCLSSSQFKYYIEKSEKVDDRLLFKLMRKI